MKGLYYEKSKGRWTVAGRDGRKYLWYRVVMWNELGRELRSDEIVHHINGDSSDDRVENLQVVDHAEHFAIHRAQGDFDHVLANLRVVSQRSNDALNRQVTLTCAECGELFKRPRSRVKGTSHGNFCSQPCKIAFQTGRSRAA